MKALPIAAYFLEEEGFTITKKGKWFICFEVCDIEFIIKCLPSRISDYVFELHAENIYPITKQNLDDAIQVANDINVEFGTKCSVDAERLRCNLYNAVCVNKQELTMYVNLMYRVIDEFSEGMSFKNKLKTLLED